jgi:hypothetical protein
MVLPKGVGALKYIPMPATLRHWQRDAEVPSDCVVVMHPPLAGQTLQVEKLSHVAELFKLSNRGARSRQAMPVSRLQLEVASDLDSEPESLALPVATSS